jgi:hypothetical protein
VGHFSGQKETFINKNIKMKQYKPTLIAKINKITGSSSINLYDLEETITIGQGMWERTASELIKDFVKFQYTHNTDSQWVALNELDAEILEKLTELVEERNYADENFA